MPHTSHTPQVEIWPAQCSLKIRLAHWSRNCAHLLGLQKPLSLGMEEQRRPRFSRARHSLLLSERISSELMFKASPKVAWTCAWLTFHTHTHNWSQLDSTGLPTPAKPVGPDLGVLGSACPATPRCPLRPRSARPGADSARRGWGAQTTHWPACTHLGGHSDLTELVSKQLSVVVPHTHKFNQECT